MFVRFMYRSILPGLLTLFIGSQSIAQDPSAPEPLAALDDETMITNTAAVDEPAVDEPTATAVSLDFEDLGSPWETKQPPNMIGGLLGGGLTASLSPSLAGTVARGGNPIRISEVAENNSAIPQDRLYFNYDYFQSAFGRGGSHVRWYKFGAEKTFRGGQFSLNLRIPLTGGPGPIQTIDPIPGVDLRPNDLEFENVTLAIKALLLRSESLALAAGLGFDIPLGPKSTFLSVTGARWQVRNQTLGVFPYLAALCTPNDRWFSHGFLSWDIPIGQDSAVYTRPAIGAFPATAVKSQLQHQTYMNFDMGIGYRPACRLLRHIIPALELHYSTNLDDADIIRVFDPFLTSGSGMGITTIGNPLNRMDIITITFGVTLELRSHTNLTLANAVPLQQFGGGQQVFDWNFQLQLTRQFGP